MTSDDLTAKLIDGAGMINSEQSFVHSPIYPQYVGSKRLRCTKYDWAHMIALNKSVSESSPSEDGLRSAVDRTDGCFAVRAKA